MILELTPAYIAAALIICLIWGGGISTMVEVNRRRVNKAIEKGEKIEEKQEHDRELLYRIDGKLDIILRHNGYLKKVDDDEHEGER